jgi:hypothetical protein
MMAPKPYLEDEARKMLEDECRARPSEKPSLLRRLHEAFKEARIRQAERQIARVLERCGSDILAARDIAAGWRSGGAGAIGESPMRAQDSFARDLDHAVSLRPRQRRAASKHAGAQAKRQKVGT